MQLWLKLSCSMAALTLFTIGTSAQVPNQTTTPPTQTQGTMNPNARPVHEYKGHKEAEAKIVNVDTKNNTVSVKMMDPSGNKTEKTFHLAGETEYFDSTGRVAAADIFQAGDYVLIIEEEGKIHQLRHNPNKPNVHRGVTK